MQVPGHLLVGRMTSAMASDPPAVNSRHQPVLGPVESLLDLEYRGMYKLRLR